MDLTVILGPMKSGKSLELVSLRAIGIGRTIQATLAPAAEATPMPVTPRRRRAIRFERGPNGTREVDVYDSEVLAPGRRVGGPAVIDASDTTIWIPPASVAEIDARGTLVLALGERDATRVEPASAASDELSGASGGA